MKLSYAQTRAIYALSRQDGWASAYQIKRPMSVLHALAKKGLARSTSKKGGVLVRSKDVMWRITEAGRQALKGGE